MEYVGRRTVNTSHLMGNFFLQRLLGELGGGLGQVLCLQSLLPNMHACEGGTPDKETSNHGLVESKT